jgi:hypothetical protein
VFYFKLVVNSTFLLQGIPVPLVYATNEIPISIKELEKGKRGQARNIGSGTLQTKPSLGIFIVSQITMNSYLGKFYFVSRDK